MARRRKKPIFEMEIEEVLFPNKGVGRYKEDKVIVKGGIAGQIVKVMLTRKKKDYYEGKILEVIKRSPIEGASKCPHSDKCGGCMYQTLDYAKELNIKEELVKELFREENLEDIEFLGIEPSPRENEYRNKMEFTFGNENGELALGLHARGKFYEIVEVKHCNIIDEDFRKIRNEVVGYLRGKKIPHYHKKRHEGILRHLVIRKALSTGEILVNLVTSSQGELELDELIEKLNNLSLDGKITGFLHTINDNLADAVNVDILKILYGRDYLIEEILGLKFKISPFSFFQTNTFGAEKLYSIARDFAGDVDDKVVFDLYSGTGTISMIMAPLAKKVVGIEIVEEAVEMAKENAKLNNLDNVEFIAGDVLKEVENLKEKPDLIIVDPPRTGINPKAIGKIIDFNPDKFVYISCNPVTLVRDLKEFENRGYKVDKVKLMDMFPKTPHVECIALIQKEII